MVNYIKLYRIQLNSIELYQFRIYLFYYSLLGPVGPWDLTSGPWDLMHPGSVGHVHGFGGSKAAKMETPALYSIL